MASSQRSPNRDPEHLVVGLVDDIYSAALDPNLWQGVVRRVVEAVGGASGQLLSPTENVLASLWATCGFDPSIMVPYAQYYHALDVWTLAADAIGLPVCQGIPGERLLEFKQFKHSEYYQDFLRPHDFERIVCCYIDKPQDRPKTSLSVYRPPGAEPFDKQAVELMSAVAPHVRRAVNLHWRISDLEHKQATNTAVLDQLSVGVVLVDETLRVTYLNPAALAIVQANDGLAVINHELTAALGTETAELSGLLAGAVRLTMIPGGSRTGTTTVSRQSTRSPYRLSVIPITRKEAFPTGRHSTAAIVFISGAQQSPQLGVEALANVYGLTPAETRLVRELVAGCSIKQVATLLSISINTAHTQLSAVFRKTGTHRQTQLVQLAASLTGREVVL
jgi:DNA-binding CsgD family transcriptional regulator/PAS domain-containing protein